MTKKTEALYQALPEIARGYIDALLSNQGFWPEDDESELARWDGADEFSFTEESYKLIADDCQNFIEILEAGAGEAALDGIDLEDLGYSFYMCRMHSGHDPDFGSDKIDDAIVEASEKLGEAFAEVGWWRRISHQPTEPGYIPSL